MNIIIILIAMASLCYIDAKFSGLIVDHYDSDFESRKYFIRNLLFSMLIIVGLILIFLEDMIFVKTNTWSITAVMLFLFLGLIQNSKFRQKDIRRALIRTKNYFALWICACSLVGNIESDRYKIYAMVIYFICICIFMSEVMRNNALIYCLKSDYWLTVGGAFLCMSFTYTAEPYIGIDVFLILGIIIEYKYYIDYKKKKNKIPEPHL